MPTETKMKPYLRSAYTRGLVTSCRDEYRRVKWPFLPQNLVAGTKRIQNSLSFCDGSQRVNCLWDEVPSCKLIRGLVAGTLRIGNLKTPTLSRGTYWYSPYLGYRPLSGVHTAVVERYCKSTSALTALTALRTVKVRWQKVWKWCFLP